VACVGDGSRILIVDDHPLLAGGLRAMLEAKGHRAETVSGPDPETIIAAAQRLAPHLVLLDLMLGDGVGSGVDLIGPLRVHANRVVVVSGSEDRLLFGRALEAGADGIVRKGQDLDDVLQAIDDALAGRDVMSPASRIELLQNLERHRAVQESIADPIARLTPREHVVLTRLMDGHSAEEIAAVETVSLATVRSQIRSILQKLNVRSQLAAVAIARRAYVPVEGHVDRPTGPDEVHQHW
jgi:DNA-binding NarL/FixJ family response regulator